MRCHRSHWYVLVVPRDGVQQLATSGLPCEPLEIATVRGRELALLVSPAVYATLEEAWRLGIRRPDAVIGFLLSKWSTQR